MKSIQKVAQGTALFVGLLFAHLAVFAAGVKGFIPRTEQQSAMQQLPLWSEDVGPFLDSILSSQIRLYEIPGAVVAVVHGNRILHLGGYGLADLQQNKLVSAETTLFRAGSVSKLFTWTALMQFVEQGGLDLQADVNQYLTAGSYLVPEHDLGLYVAYNRGQLSDAPLELLHAFLGRFFPIPPWALSAPVPMIDSDVGRFLLDCSIRRVSWSHHVPCHHRLEA